MCNVHATMWGNKSTSGIKKINIKKKVYICKNIYRQMFLRAMCFFFLLFLKTKNVKNLTKKKKQTKMKKKKNHPDKKWK